MGKYDKTMRESAVYAKRLAAIKAQHDAAEKKKVDAAKKKKVIGRVAKGLVKIREMFYGPAAYRGKKFPPSKGSPAARGEAKIIGKAYKSKRMTATEGRLRKAGLTEEEIKRFTR